MTLSNGQVMRRINEYAEETNLPLIVTRARTETRELSGGRVREIAIFTLAMPDYEDSEGTMTIECTGHQLRYLWAGMQLVGQGAARWLPWTRQPSASAVAS